MALADLWQKYRLFLLMLLAGVLLLVPGSRNRKQADSGGVFTEEEVRLCTALERMEGVGEVTVLLARGPGRSDGYIGAAVVCQGAGDAAVCLRIVETVKAFTGLGADRIVVQSMKSIGGIP